MKVSSQEEYGLRCLLQVGKKSTDETPVPISEIAVREGLSVEYVGKLLMTLRRGGLVKSIRGKAGGYTLALPPDEVSLKDVLEVLSEPLYVAKHCDRFSGTEDVCVHTEDCSIRPVWQELHLFLSESLGRVKLSHLLASETKAHRMLRLSLREQAAKLSNDAPNLKRLPTVS